MAGRGITTKFGTPVGDGIQQDPTDALATLLGIDSAEGPVDADRRGDLNGSLELANLRGGRETELREHVNNDPRDFRARGNLGALEHDIHTDPFTGDAERAKADRNREQYTEAVTLNSPSNPLAQQQNHLEKFLLMRDQAQHPKTELFPGMSGGTGIVGVGGAVGGGDAFDQHTADLPPEMRQLVKGLLSYTQIIPNGSTALKAYAPLLARAQMIDPSFDPASYAQRQALKQSFTSGPESDRLRSLNALVEHIAKLDEDRAQLNNANVGGKMVNGPINFLEQMLNVGSAGHGAVPEFDTTHGHVVSEAGKYLAGAGGATDEMRRTLNPGITSNSGDEDIQGYLRSLVDLINGQFEGQLQKAGPIAGLKGELLSRLTPKARALLRSAQPQAAAGVQ